MSVEAAYDVGTVQYSTNNGLNWLPLPGGSFSLSSGWTLTARQLRDASGSLFTGQTIQVAFFFQSSSCCCSGAGWFIDDIQVF